MNQIFLFNKQSGVKKIVPKINYERLGDKIKGVRLSTGYTQDYLAEKVG